MLPEPRAEHLVRENGAIVCVCGLAAEARSARGAGLSVIIGAGDRRRTEALVAAAAAAGALCLVSFGIAGALAPALHPGDLVLSAEIVSEAGGWRGEAAWRRCLADLADAVGAATAPVLGAAEIIATRAEKAHAHRRFAALAVDLESDIVARAATEAGIRFAVLRAIADTADRDLPPAALIPLAADGTPDLGRVFSSVVRRPQQLAALLGLACASRRAFAALARAAPALHRLVADA